MNKYVSEFLSMKCSGDVLASVKPMHNASKEITESMAFITRIRDKILLSPCKYNIVDLCAGNCLTSVLSAHLLPIKNAYAFDIAKPSDRMNNVKKFQYMQTDIMQPNFYLDDYIDTKNEKTIIISVHPCRKLAWRVIDLFEESRADFMLMMPCCEQVMEVPPLYDFVLDRLGSYDAYCYSLAHSIPNKYCPRILKDNNCISPKNNIITARR